MRAQTAATTPVRTFLPRERTTPAVGAYLREIWDRRDFIDALARSEMRASHFDTFLGRIWTVLNPALMACVYFILLGIVRQNETRSNAERFTLLIACLYLFLFTRIGVVRGAGSIIGNARLMLNSYFPRAMLPMAAVYKAFLELLLSLGVYSIIHVATGRPTEPVLLLLPLLLLTQLVFTVGVAMLLAPVVVYVRDTVNFMAFITRVWLYMTPVLFPVEFLTPNVKAVLLWNPLYPLFAAYQKVLVGETPSLGLVGGAVAWAVAAFVAGGLFLLSRERQLAVRI